MVCNMGTCIQRNGQAGGGGVRTHGIVSEGPQKQPGQQTDVGDTLNEFFRSVREEGSVKGDFMFCSVGCSANAYGEKGLKVWSCRQLQKIKHQGERANKMVHLGGFCFPP